MRSVVKTSRSVASLLLQVRIEIKHKYHPTYQVKIWCSSVVGSDPSSKRVKRWKPPILAKVRIKNGAVCMSSIWYIAQSEFVTYLFP